MPTDKICTTCVVHLTERHFDLMKDILAHKYGVTYELITEPCSPIDCRQHPGRCSCGDVR